MDVSDIHIVTGILTLSECSTRRQTSSGVRMATRPGSETGAWPAAKSLRAKSLRAKARCSDGNVRTDDCRLRSIDVIQDGCITTPAALRVVNSEKEGSQCVTETLSEASRTRMESRPAQQEGGFSVCQRHHAPVQKATQRSKRCHSHEGRLHGGGVGSSDPKPTTTSDPAGRAECSLCWSGARQSACRQDPSLSCQSTLRLCSWAQALLASRTASCAPLADGRRVRCTNIAPKAAGAEAHLPGIDVCPR